MEGENDEKIKELQSKIAILKADRDDLYTKLVIAKQAIESLHTDIGQIMEYIVNKRKDLSEIGHEFSASIQSDNEYKIHDIEYEFPNLHALVARDFEKALEQNPGINRIRLRGVNLFKNVNISFVKSMYPSIPDDKLDSYLDIIWDNMSFYEKKNWMEKRVVYTTIEESSEEEVPSENHSDAPANTNPADDENAASEAPTAASNEAPATEVPTEVPMEVPEEASMDVQEDAPQTAQENTHSETEEAAMPSEASDVKVKEEEVEVKEEEVKVKEEEEEKMEEEKEEEKVKEEEKMEEEKDEVKEDDDEKEEVKEKEKEEVKEEEKEEVKEEEKQEEEEKQDELHVCYKQRTITRGPSPRQE